MALSANFVADFSSFMDATREAVSAMQGFKLTAQELGPAADRGLAETQRQAEQLGRGLRQVGIDASTAASGFIQAFTEEQDAVNALTTALTATGNATPAVVAQYQSLATQFQATTKYADEAVIAAQATLTTIGTVGPENMELALTAVTNLASGMKTDLNQAALLVAKAFESGGEHLGKLKQLLGDAYKPGMDAAEMLKAINEKFGPAAVNELQTYNGQIENMKNKMSDLNEQVGGVLVGMLTNLLDAFRAIPEPIQKVIIAVGTIGTAIAPVLVSIASLVSILGTIAAAPVVATIAAIVAALVGSAGLAYASVKVAEMIVANWDKIVDYTKAMYEGVKRWLVDGLAGLVSMVQDKINAIVSAFRGAYQAIVGGSIVPDLINGIRTHFGQLDSAMVQPVRDASAESIRAYMELMRYTNQANAILRENSLYTTRSQLDRIAALPLPGRGAGAASGSKPVTVNNTITLSGGDEAMARKVADEIMRTIRAGTQLGTA